LFLFFPFLIWQQFLHDLTQLMVAKFGSCMPIRKRSHSISEDWQLYWKLDVLLSFSSTVLES
jgi:hypothetical protein